MRCRHKTKPPRFQAKPPPIIRGLHQIPIWDNRALRSKRGRLLQPAPTVNNVSTMVKVDGLASAQSLSQDRNARQAYGQNARFSFYHAKLMVALGDFDVDDFCVAWAQAT
jgi:hypothetical protein